MSSLRPNWKLAAGAFALLVSGTAAWAHHNITAKFDPKATMELKGVVTYVDWRNPHAHLFVNVKNGNAVENWAVELESPSILELDGWHDDNVRAGDTITIKGMRARDNSRQLWADDVTLADGAHVFGKKVTLSNQPLSLRAVPRWPDGQPALGALPGMAGGFWTDPSETALIEDGVNVAMNEYGLLDNIADASKVAPMQPWALALYTNRQSRQLRDDPMFVNCKPPGGPRQYQSRLGFELMEDRKTERVFLLMGSGNRNYRIIYLDGREKLGQVGGDDDNPLYFGRASGHWEGNTLVVETGGFNEDFWFTQGGLPHTSLLKLTERFTRTDFDTLRYEVEVDDPGAYTRKWSASWTLKWNGGAILPSHFCQNNRP